MEVSIQNYCMEMHGWLLRPPALPTTVHHGAQHAACSKQVSLVFAGFLFVSGLATVTVPLVHSHPSNQSKNT